MSKTATATKDFKTQFTVKVTSLNLLMLSKFLADLRSRFKVFSQSKIMFSEASSCYYAYANIELSEVAEKLQEISLYPPGVQP